MKNTILGLDLGTNSIGWALVEHDFEEKESEIIDAGSRIIPMSQDVLGKFDAPDNQFRKRLKERSTGVSDAFDSAIYYAGNDYIGF